MEFVSDSPLRNPEADKLGRWEFSKRVAHSIVSREDPASLVIGIHGPWGSGKTTAINFIQRAFDESDRVASFRFNPWRTKGEDELVLSFFQALAKALDRALKSGAEQVAGYLNDYAKALKPFQLDSAFEAAGDAIGEPGLEELRDRVEEALAGEEKRIVVFMDDIDRMDKGAIQNVFRLVKLTADFPNVIYVLAFDRNLVARALREEYPSDGGRSGYDFLEKIIQVPLDLPAARTRPLREMCLSGVLKALSDTGIELSESEMREFGRSFGRGIAPAIETPRMAKRYVNITSFALPILRGEVHPVDQLMIEGIRVLYPDVYSHIRSNRDLYLDGVDLNTFFNDSEDDEQQEKIQEAISDLNDTEQESLWWLLGRLFPNASSSSTTEENLIEEQRIASPKYFDRYFSYSLSDQEISDIELENFIANLKQRGREDFNEVLSQFAEFLKDGRPDVLVEKLRVRVGLHDEWSASLLSVLISMSGDHFPQNVEDIGLTTYRKAYFLIEDLLEKQSPSVRRKTGEAIVDKGYLPFSVRTIASLCEGGDSEGLFRKSDIEDLLERLGARIEEEAGKQSLIGLYSDEAPRILYWWKETQGKEATSAHVKKVLKESTEQVFDLLLGMVPTVQSHSGERMAPFPADFKRSQYETLKEYVDPHFIYSVLREDVLGQEVESPEYVNYHRSDDSDEVRIAKQFVAIHSQAEEESNQSEGSSKGEDI